MILNSEYRDVPIFWFARLERAVKTADYTTAAEAESELKRLGVRVRYGHPPDGRRQKRGVCGDR